MGFCLVKSPPYGLGSSRCAYVCILRLHKTRDMTSWLYLRLKEKMMRKIESNAIVWESVLENSPWKAWACVFCPKNRRRPFKMCRFIHISHFYYQDLLRPKQAFTHTHTTATINLKAVRVAFCLSVTKLPVQFTIYKPTNNKWIQYQIQNQGNIAWEGESMSKQAREQYWMESELTVS